MTSKHFIIAVSLMVALASRVLAQTSDINQLINNPKNQDEVVSAFSGNHELIMKLIDKLSEHPHFVMMMKERFGEAAHSDQRSPYAGQETQSIKALSDEQIQQYLNGEGMGMAKPAELNGYPGPRHVLDISSELQLSAQARQGITDAYDVMHTEAVRLGKLIVGQGKKLDSLFVSKGITSAQLTKAVEEIGRLQGALRLAHLKAHLKTTSLLTTEQIATYKKIRGYNGTGMHHDHHN